MTKIGICGFFNHNLQASDGQSIKTRNISSVLKETYGVKEVSELDTKDWKENKITFLINCIKIAIKSENLLILPAINGVKILLPLFVVICFFSNTKLHYIVIGGWLPSLIKKNKFLQFYTKKVNHIYVETNTMKKLLAEINIENNVQIMKNFKKLDSISINEKEVIDVMRPLKMCTVSRINKNKGIDVAIRAIENVNNKYEVKKVHLDIYGPIDESYNDEFQTLLKKYSQHVTYKGVIPYNKTVSIIRDYYLLLFPTKYFTEGIPGTIIDSYFSGVPVVASKWESWEDVIKYGETGYTYQFGNEKEFNDLVLQLTENVELVKKMSIKCIEESKKYTAQEAMGVLKSNF